MFSRLPWIGLLSVGLVALTSLADEGRLADSLWAEIYKTAWAGIYTKDQASRGESVYRERCAACHGASLEGTELAPSLTGRDFRDDWNCTNIADLFEKIKFTMPANRPGRLSEAQSADILAFILKFNGFPAGSSALPANPDDLRGLRFVAVNPGG